MEAMNAKNGDFHEKPLRMKTEQEEYKFLGRLLSKESAAAAAAAAAAPSFRIYYGGDVSSGVPFVWETRPGTPKHPSAVDYDLRPLAPPPGSSFNGNRLPGYTATKSRSKMLFQTLARKVYPRKGKSAPGGGGAAVISSSPSSLSTMSWSSSSHSLFYDPKRRRRRFPRWGSYAEECEQETGTSRTRGGAVLVVQFKRAWSSILGRGSTAPVPAPGTVHSGGYE